MPLQNSASVQGVTPIIPEKLYTSEEISRVLLCPPDLRRPIFETLARNFSAWQVISAQEIDRLFWLESAAELF